MSKVVVFVHTKNKDGNSEMILFTTFNNQNATTFINNLFQLFQKLKK